MINVMKIIVVLNTKSCKCYCLEKKGNQISKQLIGDTYNSCFSVKHRTNNKKKCTSSKYIGVLIRNLFRLVKNVMAKNHVLKSRCRGDEVFNINYSLFYLKTKRYLSLNYEKYWRINEKIKIYFEAI